MILDILKVVLRWVAVPFEDPILPVTFLLLCAFVALTFMIANQSPTQHPAPCQCVCSCAQPPLDR